MTIAARLLVFAALIFALGIEAGERDTLGSSYSECVARNLQHTQSGIAAVSILSVCFEQFCNRERPRIFLPPVRTDGEGNGKRQISTRPERDCRGYRDEDGARRIKTRCADSDFEWGYEDNTCPYRISDD